MSKINPLETGRFYKVRNPRKNFLCALCTAPRQMKYSKNLTGKHYIEILVLSATAITICVPLVGVKAALLFFPVWMAIEISNKLLYRKDIPCPYCGFDATWYRRDVTVANKKVKDFWITNFPDLVNPPGPEEVEETIQINAVDPDLSEDASQQNTVI